MHAPPGTELPNGPECTFDEGLFYVYCDCGHCSTRTFQSPNWFPVRTRSMKSGTQSLNLGYVSVSSSLGVESTLKIVYQSNWKIFCVVGIPTRAFQRAPRRSSLVKSKDRPPIATMPIRSLLLICLVRRAASIALLQTSSRRMSNSGDLLLEAVAKNPLPCHTRARQACQMIQHRK